MKYSFRLWASKNLKTLCFKLISMFVFDLNNVCNVNFIALVLLKWRLSISLKTSKLNKYSLSGQFKQDLFFFFSFLFYCEVLSLNPVIFEWFHRQQCKRIWMILAYFNRFSKSHGSAHSCTNAIPTFIHNPTACLCNNLALMWKSFWELNTALFVEKKRK